MLYVNIIRQITCTPSHDQATNGWPYGNSCTWENDVWLNIFGTNKLKSAQRVKQEAHKIG